MTPYVCKNTVVKNNYGRVGKVIGVDRNSGVTVVQSDNSFWTAKTNTLTVLSYKGV